MFPIAWVVVEVENEECWTWFLRTWVLLMVMVLHLSSVNQQKGLLNALRNLAPHAEHRNCARHVYCNWKKEFKGATLKNMFWNVVRCTYQEAWNDAVEEMKAENHKAYKNFIERDPARFCKAFISIACVSDMIDNNVSETFNDYIVRARYKHIIHMLEDIREALRERQYVKLEMIKKVNEKLCPNIRKKIERHVKSARFCKASLGIDGSFEVKHMISEYRFIVSLKGRTCTCRLWNVTGIPCTHAISAIHLLRHDPTNYVHPCFTVEVYKNAYAFGLPAINGRRMWPKGIGYLVQPPRLRKMPGRPKKNIRREVDEPKPTNAKKMRRTGVVMTCKNCKQVEDNSRGCKLDKIPKPPKVKDKPCRPRKHPDSAGPKRKENRVDSPSTATTSS